MVGEKKLQKSLHWLADQWDKRVKEVMGDSYRGGLYWTWDSGHTVNIELAVWKGDAPIGSEWVSLGPIEEGWEEDWQYFQQRHKGEDEWSNKYLRAQGILERELWEREIENLGTDFIFYDELKELLMRFKKGDIPTKASPHYGASSPYAKFEEFSGSTQGPYYGGN
jgi:hypothetical protein